MLGKTWHFKRRGKKTLAESKGKKVKKNETESQNFPAALPLASWTPVSAPTAAAVSPDRTICPPPWRVASASVATAWAAASLGAQERERKG